MEASQEEKDDGNRSLAFVLPSHPHPHSIAGGVECCFKKRTSTSSSSLSLRSPLPPHPLPPAAHRALCIESSKYSKSKSTRKKNAGRRPSFPSSSSSSPPLSCRPNTSSRGLPARRPLLTRPAAFGLGGGGSKKPSTSNSNKTGDAMASAAAEAEAAAAKVGESVSEAAEALAAEVAAEAAEAGAAASGASSALSPAAPAPVAAASTKEAAATSLPPAPVRSAGGRARGESRNAEGGKTLSLPRFAQQQRRPTTLAGRRARGLARVLLYAGVAYALLSLGAAVMRVARRANSPRAQRLRTVDKNKRVVQTLNAVFLAAGAPADAASTSSSSAGLLTPALAKKLKAETGFSGPEVFRKYLWYVLRERRFDSTAVNDLVALRQALALSDEDVASALKERAQRIYDKVRERGNGEKRTEREKERDFCSFNLDPLHIAFPRCPKKPKKNSKKKPKTI